MQFWKQKNMFEEYGKDRVVRSTELVNRYIPMCKFTEGDAERVSKINKQRVKGVNT